MKNHLKEIEKELKRLELIDKEKTVYDVSDLVSFLIEDSFTNSFYMTNIDMEEEKKYLRIENFFKNNETVQVKNFSSKDDVLKIELEVNGQTFKRAYKEDNVHLLETHPFFELLMEINVALNGKFLSIPKLGGYVFCGLYIQDDKEAKRLEELFNLYAVSATEPPQLTIKVYPSKAENSKLKNIDIELLKENIPQSTGINHSILSANKQKFIMACADENIYIWNRKEKSLETKLLGHSDHVKVLAHHPQNNILVSGACNLDSTLKVWDTKKHTLLKTIGKQGDENTIIDDPNNRSYYLLEFIDKGNYLIAIYSNPEEEHTLEVFETENFTLLQAIALKHRIHLLKVSPKGELIALYNNYENSIQLLKFTNRTIKAYKEFSAKVVEGSQLFFSEDEKYLCEYSHRNSCMNLWEIEKYSFSKKIHKGYLDQSQVPIAFVMLTNENLFAIQYKYKIVIWDSKTKKVKLEITEESYNYQSINFDHNASHLIKYYDKTCKVWSVKSGEEILEDEELETISSIASTSSFLLKNLDGITINATHTSMVFFQTLYYAQTDTLSRNLVFFNSEEKELKRLFIDDLEDTKGIYFLADEQYVCVTQRDALRIFEVESQREIVDNEYRELLEETLMFNIEKIEQKVEESTTIVKEEDEYLFFSKSLYAQAFTPKGNILTLGTEKGIEFWDIENKKLLNTWEISDGTYLQHANNLSYIDEKHLVVSLNADLFIITIDSQEITHCFADVDSFTLHQEQKLLAFSQREKSQLVLFSLAKEKVLKILYLDNTLDALAFNHDATLIVGSQLNHYLTVWETQTFKKVYRESSEQTCHCDNFSKLMFTDDGEKLIAINSWCNEIEVRQVNAFFSWRKWAVVKEFDAISSAINPKTKTFALACNEKEHLAFMNHKFKKEKSLPLDPEELHANSLLYSPDGKYLSLIDQQGFVKLYSTEKTKLESILIAGRQGNWLVIDNEQVRDAGSLDLIAKNIRE